MHELALAVDMVEAITDKIKAFNEARVTRVVLEVGKLAAVLPDALKFSFEICCRDTALEGARLEIIETDDMTLKIREVEVD